MENIFCIDAEPTLEEYYSQDSMKMYMNDIAKIPLLTAEEEKQLAQLIAENGPDAMAAKDKI